MPRLAAGSLAVVFLSAAVVAPLPAQDSRYDAELRRLAERPEVREAFRVIERIDPASRDDLITLTQIPARPRRGAKGRGAGRSPRHGVPRGDGRHGAGPRRHAVRAGDR